MMQKGDSFVIKGMIEYIRDYLRYELERIKRDEKEKGTNDIFEKDNEIYTSLDKVYELFIRFIVAWNGKGYIIGLFLGRYNVIDLEK